MLESGFPTLLAWGADVVGFHNDAFVRLLGERQVALGRPFEEIWPTAHRMIGPVAKRALSGEAGYLVDLPLTLDRDGRPEETWWSFSYAPVLDGTGGVGGVLATVHETTGRVSAEWRLRFLAEVGLRLRGMADPREVAAAAVAMLGRHLAADRAGCCLVDPAGASLTLESEWAGFVPVFLWRADAAGAITYANDRWCAYIGRAPEDAMPRGGLASVHPDGVERTEAAWDDAVRTGKRYEVAHRMRSADGAYR